jgi:hypothetical protein
MADYFVVVVLEGKWQNMYVWTREEMRNAEVSIFIGKDGKQQHWFESKIWTKDQSAVAAWGKVAPSIY